MKFYEFMKDAKKDSETSKKETLYCWFHVRWIIERNKGEVSVEYSVHTFTS